MAPKPLIVEAFQEVPRTTEPDVQVAFWIPVEGADGLKVEPDATTISSRVKTHCSVRSPYPLKP